jgi:hypothetical protein
LFLGTASEQYAALQVQASRLVSEIAAAEQIRASRLVTKIAAERMRRFSRDGENPDYEMWREAVRRSLGEGHGRGHGGGAPMG